MLRQVNVLGVVEVCIRRVEDGVDHPGLQVQEHSAGDVMLIISLGEMMMMIIIVIIIEGDLFFRIIRQLCQWSTVENVCVTITPSSGNKLFCKCVTWTAGG